MPKQLAECWHKRQKFQSSGAEQNKVEGGGIGQTLLPMSDKDLTFELMTTAPDYIWPL